MEKSICYGHMSIHHRIISTYYIEILACHETLLCDSCVKFYHACEHIGVDWECVISFINLRIISELVPVWGKVIYNSDMWGFMINFECALLCVFILTFFFVVFFWGGDWTRECLPIFFQLINSHVATFKLYSSHSPNPRFPLVPYLFTIMTRTLSCAECYRPGWNLWFQGFAVFSW